MAELRLTRRARTDIMRLPRGLQEAVLESLTAIEADPREAGKELVGRLRGLWSARVGSYRILYTLTDEGETVIVGSVRHRAAAYRRRSL